MSIVLFLLSSFIVSKGNNNRKMHRNLLSTVLLALLDVTVTHAQYFALTGVQTGQENGTRPVRRNINDLQQNDAPTL